MRELGGECVRMWLRGRMVLSRVGIGQGSRTRSLLERRLMRPWMAVV